ncbi:hypothetical protein PybrP1_005659 [[Pythium] brassicae (nom. inval.)]|nr:hypothetical protein PybrP1_005659 [[Pythium] brassicae (nom. inval.)]
MSQFTSTVYYRKQSNGSIFAFDNRDQRLTEMERSHSYARFVGMTLHQRAGRIFWSDSRAIKSAYLDGSVVQTLVGALARVQWFGVNFGSAQSDVVELLVKGTQCVSVLAWSPETVECLVGLPLRYPPPPSTSIEFEGTTAIIDFLTPDDCAIRTTRGSMRGAAPNYGEMRAAGYPSPIVERIEVHASFVLPHALAVNDDNPDRVPATATEQWLYWSNSADGKIYRSSLDSTRIEVVQDNAWGVRGLALGGRVSTTGVTASPTYLYFSQESKGTIARVSLDSFASPPPTGQQLPRPEAEIVLRGLDSPRGLALDSKTRALYFTEKTGRIFKATATAAGSSTPATTTAAAASETKVGPLLTARRVVTVSALSRLDGVAVDSK